MAAKELVIDVKMQNQALKAEINRLNGQLDTLKKQAKDTGGGFNFLEGTVGKFNMSGASAMGMVTKFAGVLGVATTAGQLFGRMMATNQGLGDAVARVQQQVNSAMDYFANSLASMDFNNFISGMRQAVIEGGKLADMLDQLQSDLQVLGVRGAKTKRDIGELYLDYYNTNDLKKRQQIMDQILAKEQQQREETKKIAAEQRATGIQTLKAAAPGASEKDILKMIETYSDEELKRRAARYEQALVKQNAHKPGSGFGSPMSMSGAMMNGSYRVSQDAKYFQTPEAKIDQRAFQLMNTQDEDGGALKKARDLVRGAYDMETQVINEEVAILRKKNKTDAQAEAAAKKLLTTSTTTKPTPPPAGSMAAYDAQIGDLKKKLTFETDPNNMVKIQKEINRLTEEKQSLQFQFNLRMWEAEHGKLQAVIDRKSLVVPVKLEIDNAKLDKQLKELGEKIKKQLQQQAIDALSKGMVKANKFSDTLDAASSAAGSLGDALRAVGDANNDVAIGFQMFGQIAGMLSTIVPIIQAMTMSEEELAAAKAKGAISGAAASAAETPIIGWLLVGAAVAACVAALAAMGNYASGGIVGGSSLVGDNVLARLNGGEMVLNQGQQARLFNLLDGTASLGGGSGEITWKLRGADLYGSLRNYNNIKKRVRG